MYVSNLDSTSAFIQAGSTCFVKVHNAKTLYVVASDDYLYPTCGDHLSNGVREVAHLYSPPLDRVEVFWKPL